MLVKDDKDPLQSAIAEAKKQKLHKSDDYKKALKLFETEMLKQKLFLKELMKKIGYQN